VIALSLTLASVPCTGVMSAGAAAGAVVAVDTEAFDDTVESCAAGALSCFAHPASASTAAESVAIEVKVARVAVSDIWRIVKLL